MAEEYDGKGKRNFPAASFFNSVLREISFVGPCAANLEETGINKSKLQDTRINGR